MPATKRRLTFLALILLSWTAFFFLSSLSLPNGHSVDASNMIQTPTTTRHIQGSYNVVRAALGLAPVSDTVSNVDELVPPAEAATFKIPLQARSRHETALATNVLDEPHLLARSRMIKRKRVSGPGFGHGVESGEYGEKEKGLRLAPDAVREPVVSLMEIVRVYRRAAAVQVQDGTQGVETGRLGVWRVG